MVLCRHHSRGNKGTGNDLENVPTPPGEDSRPPVRFHEEVPYLGGPCDVYSRPGTDQEEIESVPD
eukprot:9979391-Heterocapsa_arctica.AAC.1